MVTKKRVSTKKVARKAPARKTTVRSAPARKTPPAVDVGKVGEGALPPVVPSTAAIDKSQLVRDSFTMPKSEYELLALLKARLLALSKAAKKSELLRAGVVLLATLSDAELLVAVDRIPNLKTGRPKKVKDAAKASKKSA